VQKTGSTTLTTGGKDDGSVAAAMDEVIGSRTRVKVVKNKVAPPFRQAEFDVIYATGISKEGEMIDLGVKYSVLEKSGNFFRFGDETIGQGREQARIFLLQNPKIAEKIEKAIRTAAGV